MKPTAIKIISFLFGAVLAQVFLAVLLAALVHGAPPVNSPNYKVDGHVNYNAGNRAEVPPGALLTVIVSDQYASNPKEAQLVQWFNTDPGLVALTQKAQLKSRPNIYTAIGYDRWATYWSKKGAPTGDPGWNLYLASNPHYTQRLATHFGGPPPIVSIQDKAGKWLMKISGDNIPGSAGELADLCYAAIEEANPAPKFEGQKWDQIIDEKGDGVPPLWCNCLDCDCVNCECDGKHPGQCPGPYCPTPKPNDTPTPRIVPDIRPIPKKIKEVTDYWPVGVAAVVVGGAVLVGRGGKKSTKRNSLHRKG